MAVVQISRLQIRRGQKNQGSGIPQLASGELGWAIDAQELYIGNGSVSEGSPAVGNTQVLTEADNLFEFADTYTYKNGSSLIQTGDTETTPIIRTLQERLDDRVSIRSFGVLGDGSECSERFQRAIDQLYVSANTPVTLYVEAGTYEFNKTIYIPPFTTIVGAGIDKTIFTTTNDFSGAVFQTVGGNITLDTDTGLVDYSSTDYSDQPRSILLDSMTITNLNSSIGLYLHSVKDSMFRNIKLVSEWTIGDAIAETSKAIHLTNLSSVVTCEDNMFNNIEIEGYSYGIESSYDITHNRFTNLKFDNLYYGIAFGKDTDGITQGQLVGPTNNEISFSEFGHSAFGITAQGIWIRKGTNNTSSHNSYFAVGNAGGDYDNPVYTNIQYDTMGNRSIEDYFKRTEYFANNNYDVADVAYIAEVGGIATYSDQTVEIEVGEYIGFTPVFKLPAQQTVIYNIDYAYKITGGISGVRNGTLSVLVDYDTDQVSVVDDFDFIGDQTYAQAFEFSAELSNEAGGSTDTVIISIKNTTTGDANGKLTLQKTTTTGI